jgi:membrane protease YdiL (CAAX protease family)
MRFPVVVQAFLVGLALSLVNIVPWAGFAAYPGLAELNTRVLVLLPWAIIPMGAWLWLFFRWLGGAGFPRGTSQARRSLLRANALSTDLWPMAILAGLVGLAALLPLLRIMSRLMTMPLEAQPITVPAQMPFVTTFALLTMSSVVAGVGEESIFRGYVQGMIERRHGPALAIFLAGIFFGLGHFNHHPADVIQMLPFYLAVSAVYGGLTYATNSILPSIVLHVGGDVFSLTRLWTTGRPEWQSAAAAPRLVWETGVDFMFVRSVLVFLVLTCVATVLYRWLYQSTVTTGRVGRPEGRPLRT